MSLQTDAGVVTPIAGTVLIVGGSNITTVAAGNSVTANLIAGPILAGSFSSISATVTTGNASIPAGNLVLGADGRININAKGLLKTIGINQTFVGEAGSVGITAARNVSMTVAASLVNSTSAADNTGIGSTANTNLTSGSYNTSLGQNALHANLTGSYNTIVSRTGFSAITAASYNTCLGYNIGFTMNAGQYNILVGRSTGSSFTTNDSHNLWIVNDAGVAGLNNTLRLGTNGVAANQQSKCYIAGIYNAAVGGVNSAVLIDNAFTVGTVVSSARFKDNIQDMDNVSSPINNLRPVTFTYKHDNHKVRCFGLIAEEVHEAMPDLVLYDDEGKPYSVGYHRLSILILNEMIKRAKIIASIKERITTLSCRLKMS